MFVLSFNLPLFFHRKNLFLFYLITRSSIEPPLFEQTLIYSYAKPETFFQFFHIPLKVAHCNITPFELLLSNKVNVLLINFYVFENVPLLCLSLFTYSKTFPAILGYLPMHSFCIYIYLCCALHQIQRTNSFQFLLRLSQQFLDPRYNDMYKQQYSHVKPTRIENITFNN